MGIKVQIFDAAHQYGLDNMDVNTTYKQVNKSILGDEVATSNDWPGSLLPGHSGVTTTTYSNGFTVIHHIENNDGNTGNVTLASIRHTDTHTLLSQISGEIPFTFPHVGTSFDPEIIYADQDNIAGNIYNNLLRGFGGNDQINGSAGIDMAFFSGFKSDYDISVKKQNSIIVNGPDGIDTLTDIERLHFEDKKIAYDLNVNAGIAARIIGAVYGKDYLASKLDVGFFLTLLDHGISQNELIELALTIRLGKEFAATDEIELLYQNLTGSRPSDSELEYWTNTLTTGKFTLTTLALMAADSEINRLNINLADLEKKGLEYATAGTLVPLSGNNVIDSLLGTYKWGEDIGTGMEISYSFRTESSIYSADAVTGYGPMDGSGEPWQSGWKSLSSSQITGLRNALESWAEVANVRLTEVTDNMTTMGDIRFSTLPGITESITYQPEPTTRGGDVWLPISNDLLTSDKGTFTYLSFLRETGHALGLDHPHEGRVIADAPIDALPISIMSLRDFTGDSLNNKRDILYPTTPMLNDIAALQYLYGANRNTRNGDTIYQWEPDQFIYETIWDGGGIDTIDWSNQTTDARIDLNAGSWSYIGPERWDGQTLSSQNLAIAYNVIIENANGGSGNDILTGNSANNLLNGGNGNDELYGGAGNDIFDWNEFYRAGNDTMYGGTGNDIYVIDTQLDTVIELPNEGLDTIWSDETYFLAENDNIEKLYLFGSEAVNATGNELSNELQGNDNDNMLDGGEGNDFLIGKAGNDQLIGGNGLDTAIFLEEKDQYLISTTEQNWRIESKLGDIDTLSGIERLNFIDSGIAYDLDGNAGRVAKIIGAVFGVDALNNKDYVGIGLNLLDNGMEYSKLIDLALNVKLGFGYSDEAEITLLYENLLGATPPESALAFWANSIRSGQFTQNSLAVMAADNDINTAQIDLIGLTQTGIEYYF